MGLFSRKPQLNSIVLLSGGLDSSLAFLRTIKEKRGEVVPMFVDYGQFPAKKERKAAEKLVNRFRYEPKIDSLVELKVQLGDPEPIGSAWGRNIALVGLAAVWAYTHGDRYHRIVLGLHQGDVGPDCKPGDFSDLLDKTLGEGTKGQIRLHLPIEELTVEEIGIELGEDYSLDLLGLYTCYWDPPCGFKSVNDTYRCPGCRRKRTAMEAAGIESSDLLDFPNGGGKGRSYQSPSATPIGY